MNILHKVRIENMINTNFGHGLAPNMFEAITRTNGDKSLTPHVVTKP